MKDINKELCEYMHSFVSEHLDEITDSYESLGFKDSEDMLEQIKSDVTVATWAISELVMHFMRPNYRNKFYVDYDYFVFQFKDSEGNIRYFTLQDEYPAEMRLEQTIEVINKFVPV
jgi:hypothetical protein